MLQKMLNEVSPKKKARAVGKAKSDMKNKEVKKRNGK
jgi:hypothetical protein